MIGRIHGKLIANTPPRLLIDCHGVGYEIDVPMSTLYQMPSIGQEVTLLTHFVVREDAQQLFGFSTDWWGIRGRSLDFLPCQIK
mgnify:CR=1 FL=1